MSQPLNPIETILLDYKNGLSPAAICKRTGITEKNYALILKKHSLEFEGLKAMRKSKQKEKRKSDSGRHHDRPATVIESKNKITAEEKLKHLEALLEKEKKKNKDLESLLELAKDHLGKF